MIAWARACWRGEVGLARAFWLHGIGAAIAFLVLSGASLLLLPARTAFIWILTMAALLVPYAAVQSVGIWRSGGSYPGSKIWVVSARVAVVVAAVASSLLGIGAISAGSVILRGFDRNSHTVAATIRRDSAHPLAGFWKSSCTDDFGFAIEPAAATTYSIVFCGPGGCFPPGSYRPNTTLVGDPAYRLIDTNTIEIQTRQGFDRLLRCQ